MLFVTDANIFVPMVDGLRRLGYDVFDIKENNLENLSDLDIFQLAQKQKRIIITMDKDFSSILLYPPGEHFGIIVAKLYKITVKEATQVFIEAMQSLSPDDIQRNIVIIDRNKTRIRKKS